MTLARPVGAPLDAAERLAGVDAWRFAGAVGIVWLHTGADGSMPNSANLGRFAVPFFAAASAYLLYESLRRNPGRDFAGFAAGRLRRIYVPFLGWSVVYLLATNLKRHFVSHVPPAPPGWSLFIAGTSLQLWFLPFVLAATMGLFPVCRAAVGMRPPARRMIAAALILIAGAICHLPVPWPGPAALGDDLSAARYVAHMSWGTLPALLAGLALAMLGVGGAKTIMPPLGVIIFVGAMARILAGGRDMALENLAGVAALAAALGSWRGPLIGVSARWGKYAYGVYLAHALFLEAFFAEVTARRIPNSRPLKLAEFTAALGLSYLLVWLLNQWRGTRWMTGEYVFIVPPGRSRLRSARRRT